MKSMLKQPSFYLLTLFCLPCLLFSFSLLEEKEEIEQLEQKLCLLKPKAKSKERQRALEEKILLSIEKTSSVPLNNLFSDCSLLQLEGQKCRLLLSELSSSEEEREAKEILLEGGNVLQFEEEVLESTPLFLEKLALQKRPVWLSEEDIKELLPRLEQEPLFLRSLYLEKKQLPGTQELCYQLTCQLIRRERPS